VRELDDHGAWIVEYCSTLWAASKTKPEAEGRSLAMKTAIVLISILLLAAVIAFIWSRSKRTEINSFWDVVRNPDRMPDLDQFHKTVDDAASSLAGSPAEIAKLVDYFVFEARSSHDAWTEKRILAKLGSEAYPRALEILCDPAKKGQLVKAIDDGKSLPEAPINRLCEIFENEATPPPEAAELLSPYLQSDNYQIRRSAAGVIGSLGSTKSLGDLRRALSDDEEYVKSAALRGIRSAISDGRIEQSSQEVVFELVSGMWPTDTSFAVCDQIPLLLLELDRERAITRLLSDDLFSARFEPVWRILEAFDEKKVGVTRDRLLTLIKDADKEPIENSYVLREALPLLGAHRNEADLPMLERFLDHKNDNVSNGAVEGLYQFHRYSDTIRDPWEVVKESGWNSLTTAEKHISAIGELDGEVRNGGFAQYYFNSSGDHWEDAMAGLAAIGAKQRRRLMVATAEKFGDMKPDTVRIARNAQLSKVVRKQEDPFNDQDSAWYKLEDENLDRLIFKYNVANLEGRQKAERSGEPKSK
jgi:hypothetical protein